MVKVTVKWQKEVFKDVEVDTSQPPLTFKGQLFTLTGVAPDRQKILVKGGQLKDDGDWAKLGLKEGQSLMMMGTADKIPEAPAEAPIFMEDIPEDERDVMGLKKYGAGLTNLGNTCYMNATLQVLYRVPELREALSAYSGAGANSPAQKFTLAAKDLFGDLERNAAAVTPYRFLIQMRELYPQFAQQNQTGMYMQQDAEECWSQLLYVFREQLKNDDGMEPPTIEKVFGVGLHTKLVCEESGETVEYESTKTELACNITIDVNQLSEGIKLHLQNDREQPSEALGRVAVFKGSSLITSLPPYLSVKLVRFYYKVDVQQKAKILRKVAFPLVLDCYEFCTEEYKKELEGPRAAWDEAQERKLAAAKTKPAANGAEKAPEEAGPSTEPESALSGVLTGRYNLVAVLTHKGRSADSGHYVSWVKQQDGTWVQFDDDELILRKEEEIPSLAGGGDWHMAYLLLYEAERVP